VPISKPDFTAQNPDAVLFGAIDEWKEAWGEVRSVDDKDPVVDVAAKAIRLERQIARMPAMTVEGDPPDLRSEW
jgi:hypothetical protein